MRCPIVLIATLTLAACQQQESSEPAQRIDFAETRTTPVAPPLESPDTEDAAWVVDEGGQAISFGKEGEPALMTLACRLGEDPPQMAIIRHAPARPGLKALYPVQGNGMRSRFLVDAKLSEGEWRWEGALPAEDPQLDVFTGTRDLTATLPGAGMLEIAGSRIPGQFVNWCRAGGQVMEAEAEEEEEAAAEEPVS